MQRIRADRRKTTGKANALRATAICKRKIARCPSGKDKASKKGRLERIRVRVGNKGNKQWI